MITPSALNSAKKLLQAAYPGVKWYDESWRVWVAALDDDGIDDGKFIHAVRQIIKNEQWYQTTALPALVKKYGGSYEPQPSDAPRLEAVNVDREENLKKVRELAELVARGFKQS